MTQRPIKFRAWMTKEKFMAECHTIACENGTHTLYVPKQGLAARLFKGKQYFEAGAGEVELMQFTGLHDKNGKPIFEGDILKYKPYNNLGHNPKFVIGYVKWGETGDSDGWSHGKHYEWVIDEDSLADIADSDYPDEASCKIIGNVYENPEFIQSLKKPL